MKSNQSVEMLQEKTQNSSFLVETGHTLKTCPVYMNEGKNEIKLSLV